MTTHILDELRWRGLIAQTTDEVALRRALTAGPVTVYAGFDPTAPSLHVGHLVPLLTLRRFQLAGHRPIPLAGGATGLVGDPRDVGERSLLDADTVLGYVERIRGQLSAFLEFEPSATAAHPAVLANNLDWTAKMTAIELLRDVGKHFSVNVMLARDTIRRRLDEGGISYTEFSYLLLQSRDYVELHRRFGCSLQIGGSDQWGNIIGGVDLIRRMDGAAVHALTVPLVTNASGEKFGKSTGGGSMWLDPALTSPYAWYQWWFNTDDDDVAARLRTFTFLDRDEIDELAGQTRDVPAARAGQRRLAAEMTALVHGAAAAGQVVAASRALFGRGELRDIDPDTLGAALREAGTVAISGPAPDLASLLQRSGLCESTSEARRTVAEGGAYLNNVRIGDHGEVPTRSDALGGRWLVLRRGKRSVAGVEWPG